MYTLPTYYIPTVGADPQFIDPGAAARRAQDERVKAVWNAATVAFVGTVGAVVGGIVMPQIADEYFEWLGGAVVGGLLFAGIAVWIQ